MSVENLQSLTKKVLLDKAKELNISGRWDMTKEQLIEAILGAEKNSGKNTSKKESAKTNVKIDNQECVAAEDKDEKESAGTEVIDMEEKKPYIENAELGTLVAFRLSNGKVKSAKIVKKSTLKRRFMLETNYGAQYIVPYDDIVWVRTGKRWPKGVYELLKGSENNEQKVEA